MRSAVLCLLVAVAIAEDARVGLAGRASRIDVVGCEAFSERRIVTGLFLSTGVLAAGQSAAPRDAWIGLVRDRVLAGYRAEGFRDATVEVAVVEGRTRISVAEGRRIVAGAVRVEGGDPEAAARVIALLIDGAPAATVAAAGQEPAFAEWLALQERAKPVWTPGDPVGFTADDARLGFARKARDAYAALGRHHAAVTADLVVAETEDAVDLVLTVSGDAPTAIAAVDVVGAARDRAEQVIAVSGLGDAPIADTPTRQRAAYRLWRSGRYRSATVAYAAPAAGAVRALITVDEAPGIPAAGAELGAEDRALIALRDHLGGALERGDGDIVATWRVAPELMLTAVVSARAGLVASLHRGDDPVGGCIDALVFTGDRCELLALEHGRRASLFSARPGIQLTVQLGLAAAEERKITTTFNLGFRSGSTVRGDGAIACEITLPPSAFLALGRLEASTTVIADGIMTWSKGGATLRSDAATGAMLGFSSESVGLACRRDAQAELLRGLDQRAAAAVAQDGDALAPALALLVDEIVSSPLLTPDATRGVRGDDAVRVCASVFALVEATFVEALDLGDGESFQVPPATGEATGDMAALLVRLLAGSLVATLEQVLPEDSWPAGLAREAALIVQRQPNQAEASLAALLADPRPGPFGCLALARLVGGLDPEAGRAFAARGLERLDTDAALADAQLVEPLLRRLSDAIGALEDPAALAAAVAPGAAPAIAPMLACIHDARRRSEQPQAWRDAVAILWESVGRSAVERALRELAGEGEPARF
ncbi:MAG TPA: hypothetical protein VEL07_21970 [Planctomycetota bacterium]|nr:hypothetical protein [Planctomycetota bacterium]